MPDGKYRFVMIDACDNELYQHSEYDSPNSFAKDIRQVGAYDEEDQGIGNNTLEQILELCPNDIRRYGRIVRSHFNRITAAILMDALDRGYRDLVKALLPDFAKIREMIFPAPHIPGISKRELERRKELLRDYYRANGYYKETEKDSFVEDSPGSVHYSVKINEDSVSIYARGRMGAGREVISLEDTEKLRWKYPELEFDRSEE